MYAWYHSTEPAPQYLRRRPGDPGRGVSASHGECPRAEQHAGSPASARCWRSATASRASATICVGAFRRARRWASLRAFASAIRGFPASPRKGTAVAARCFDGGARDRQHVSTRIARTRRCRELLGRHTVKVGRRLSPDRHAGLLPPASERLVQLHARLHARAQSQRRAAQRQATRSPAFLLGIPASGDFTIGTPNDFFTQLHGGYAQDDFRMRTNG